MTLDGKELNRAELEDVGIRRPSYELRKRREMGVKFCPRCKEHNDPAANFCARCGKRFAQLRNYVEQKEEK